jgi:2-phosphoglycerate kinase
MDATGTPEQFHHDDGFVDATGLVAPSRLNTGLPPDRALDLARRIEDHVGTSGRRTVSLDQLRVLAREVLGEHEGDQIVEQLRRWHDFEMLERPLVVLIGGGTGVGKSTVATQVARDLGVTRVSSTDFIREVLRSVVPETIAPELSRSSFELDQHLSPNGATAHAEFERQAQQVLVGVRAEIERAVREGTSLILEGIHLFPGLVDLGAVSDTLIVQVVLTVEHSDDLVDRFEGRAAGSERPAGRYEEGLEAIRKLQAHLVATARRSGIPVIENRELDATVRRVLDVIFAAVEGVRSPQRSAPAPR